MLDSRLAAAAPARAPGGRYDQRSKSFVLLAGIVLLALLWAGILYHLNHRRADVQEQTERDVTNLSVAVAEQISRLIEGTDQVMRLIQGDHDGDPDQFDFSAWMKRATYLDGIALQTAIFDANGDLLAARVPMSEGAKVNVADRTYFRHLADHPEADLYIDRTLRGRIQNRWAVQLARRLKKPDGAFGGVLVVSLDPDMLARQFGALDVGAYGSIGIIGRDGYVRARAPFATGMYEVDVTRQPHGSVLFGQLAKAPVGTYQVESALDGANRIFGYRSLGSVPLIVTVGKSVDEVMAGFREEERRALLVGAAVTVILLAALAALLRELDRRYKREATLFGAHEAIRESEARYRLIADHSTDMIVQLDPSGRRLFVSPACRRLFGYEPEQFVGTRPQDFVHPEDRVTLDDVMTSLGSGTHDSLVSSHRFRHADGTWVRVEASWQVVRDMAGEVAGFVASVRNDMARHAAETALRDSEARYRALADTLPQLVWLADAETGKTTYVNRQADAYCGQTSDWRLRQNRLALIHPEERDAVLSAFRTVEAEGSSFETELRLRRHDGAYRWHKVVMLPLKQDDRVVGWLGTALDIDESVTARRALQETSDLLRVAQDAAGAGSWDFDMVARTIEFSPESAALHGLDKRAVVLSFDEWEKLVLPTDTEQTAERVAAAIEGHTTLETEFRVRLPDGETRWLQGIGRTYYDQHGQALRMIGLNFDITRRKDFEHQLLNAKTIAEAARGEAERASAAKSEFLASMSHEVRTPLNAIIGFTDLLASSNRLEPDLRRQAELARSSASALLAIVNDVLDFSEVEAGRVTLQRHPFALAALVDNCLSIVRGTATAKGLALREVVEHSLPAGVLGDEARLRQILLNLLNNAIKFTPQGSVTLHVRHEGRTSRGDLIRFSVTDTGIGIPKDKQHRLFQRFSQVDGSIRRNFGGTGLGLAISKNLVELMGGEIGAYSEEGRGATFWFTVTLPQASLPLEMRQVNPVPVSGRRGRLLLAEDVVINQALARAVLEAAGHSVDIVSDGAAAVAAVREGDYDLVLMDVQMPGLDGVSASRQIRALDGPASTIPIVAMTANVMPDEVAEFRAAGMNDHVGKPFERAVLYALIDRLLPDTDAGDARLRDSDAPDSSTLDELLALHAPEGVVRLLGYLEEELQRSFERVRDSAEDRDRLRREAHVLVSAAGMLGFKALSAACAEFERFDEAQIAERGLDAFEEALDRIRAAVRATIVQIDRLSERLRDGAPRVAKG